ncbi:GNAT family N-acetyltransferase [Acidimicrobiia bacterium EGI L10123]|uniref:GNAT family N-acetyltransferase n=1 Tax=Salinilacustrithrix flava TaxID=2957203 RepID=UPI003D7C1957|nr:GNAT family N-acetyltransferase [Acidimicrobiia bacterium EGI L10123]
MITSPAADELAEVAAFIVAQQRRPDRNVAYLGTEPEGVAAELEGLEPAWTTTARIAWEGDRLVGAVAVEWDDEVGRSWIMGPWVIHDGDRWLAVAGELLDAALAQVPPAITRHELSGDVANQHLAELAAARGWSTTEVNHALSVDEAIVAGWDDIDVTALRPATPDDLEGIRGLHDTEFPGTYATADQLVAGQHDGTRTTLVVPDGTGGVAAYASGHLQDDGEACLDFVVVHPDHHGRGLGRQAIAAVARDLLPRSPLRRMSLTVQDHRAPARGLYERLGFRPEVSFVGYRSWEQ